MSIVQLSPMEYVCFWLAKKRWNRSELTHSDIARDPNAYGEWRHKELRLQFTSYFTPEDVRDKRVLDLGSGTGEMSAFLASIGAAHVRGCELSEQQVVTAKERFGHLAPKVEFVVSDESRINAASASVDVVTCFAVMEHVMQYDAIIREWHRVLLPGGKVLIWWSVWLHPYGHHLHTMIPLPWPHLFFSDRSLLKICARAYEDPQFKPYMWHFDDHGRKKPIPYQNSELGDLNKLSTRRFEKLCIESGFEIARRIAEPLTGEPRWLKRALAKFPVPDLFCSCFVYELEKS